MARAGTTTWVVRPSTEADRPLWGGLFRRYAATAGETLDDDHLETVWSWIVDPAGQTRCLVLQEAGPGAPVVGFAHHRVFERPLDGTRGCYLDDLYVEERVRGRGGARALLQHLHAVAAAEGCSTVRWTTGPTNPARHLYDSVAGLSPVVTYDMGVPGRS